MLEVGYPAIDFTLENQDGELITLSAFHGQTVVLYFYPKDNTPGCTTEACSFRDVYDDILDLGAVVMGVSPDTTASHGKFAEKHGLPFYLLSDPEHKVAEAYGAWGEKNMFGKKKMGIIRSTYIIDSQGKIAKVYPKVKVKEHADEILADLKIIIS